MRVVKRDGFHLYNFLQTFFAEDIDGRNQLWSFRSNSIQILTSNTRVCLFLIQSVKISIMQGKFLVTHFTIL